MKGQKKTLEQRFPKPSLISHETKKGRGEERLLTGCVAYQEPCPRGRERGRPAKKGLSIISSVSLSCTTRGGRGHSLNEVHNSVSFAFGKGGKNSRSQESSTSNFYSLREKPKDVPSCLRGSRKSPKNWGAGRKKKMHPGTTQKHKRGGATFRIGSPCILGRKSWSKVTGIHGRRKE